MRGAAGDVLASHLATDRAGAVARLLLGKHQQAVQSLTTLAQSKPNDAVLWSDLAAARYELAAAEEDAGMYASALAAADRAIRIDPASQSALFNRALVLAALSLHPPAVRAFERYRAIDPASEWSVEARQRVAALQRPSLTERWKSARAKLERGKDVESIALEFPQYARTFAESDYLARWADAFVARDQVAASHWLGIARRVGATRAQRLGDTLLADAVRCIDTTSRPQSIAQAHLAYRRGRLLYATESARVLGALPHLEAAEKQFATAGSPMALVAGYYRANALVDAHQIERAREVMEGVLVNAPEPYRALRAQLQWLRSTVAGISGQPYGSLRAALESAEHFRGVGEDENAARIENSAAATLRRLGRASDSRALRGRVFAAASATGKASLWEAALISAGRDELLERRWDAAASWFAVAIETEFVSPRLRFDAQLWRAVADAHANGEILPDLQSARVAADHIVDTAMREEVQHELDFVEGTSLLRIDAERATKLLTHVIDYRLRTANFVRLSSAYVERAQAHLAARRSDAAEADLRAALEADERAAGSIARDDLRDTFYGGVDDAYEKLIELLVKQQRLGEAADIAERFRARGLTEADARKQDVAMPIRAIAAHVPADTVVVHYTTTSVGTLVSIIRHRRHHEWVLAAPRARVMELTERLLGGVHGDNIARQRAAARELYDLLIAPVVAAWRGSATVVVVPDETIAVIPLAMLIAPTDRYLVEDFTLVHAASASMFIRHAHETPVPQDRRTKIAIVADPEFDVGTFGNMERLPYARTDATWLAAGRIVDVLAGMDATPSRVAAVLARSGAAHLATHAIADLEDAWRSVIVLAPDQGSDGALYLRQIASQNLGNLRLVTLAGCRTGAFGGGRGSVRSLSRAFLAAGAHNVIATLWNVEDAATSQLMREFFRLRDQGSSAAVALRQAQIAMLRSENPICVSPKVWASVQLQGCNR
ncbi:MAG TPA: CHAT domain-containing protein [Thermoanaerobaculia bacterium]|nr:CHAT domain-containing protein [Thermoanaerobaculia bacterium]